MPISTIIAFFEVLHEAVSTGTSVTHLGSVGKRSERMGAIGNDSLSLA